MGVTIKINNRQADNINDLFKDIDATADKIRRRIIMAVRLACLEVVKAARNLPSPPETLRHKPHQPNYIDQTGVLRASIGFVIYDRGERILENFERGGDGAVKGQTAASELAAKFPDKIVAVVVAGADYAAYVESKGYFVLSEPASHLGEYLKNYLSKIRI